ncbi:hypothetical protein EHQ58_15770 [Leptospira ognonensis]|uniref:Uncharacterized protein n=1 Tax=Leptospira ognonensis TaxID=2484945 RepID=A0A4R9JWA5_9LEPT|nr:hypothetical protein [Leptospira ognonensis]TGL56656.1 hypothetical protein EHQ58_15770 [Leptospira ognonensis]
MATLDLFKINFKKPALSTEDQLKEEKRSKLKLLMDAAFSRLESVEILNANSKLEDSILIIRLLALDLINLSLFYYGKPLTEVGKDWKVAISSIGNEKLTNLYLKYEAIFSLSAIDLEKEETKIEILEGNLSDLLSDLESYYRILNKTELRTMLSEQKFRWKIQGAVLVALLSLAIGSTGFRKLKYPELGKSKVQVFYLSKSFPSPKEEYSIINEIQIEKKGEWVDYEFVLPKSTDLIEVRIDPVQLPRVRFTTESMKFFDGKGKLIYTHDFVWGEDLLPKDKMSYGTVNEMKLSGKSVPGAWIEMESIGSDPFFHIKLPEIKGVSKIVLKMRHIEANKKFN